ncbi:MAG: DUF1232 domain-containing protein [Lachnospiraceae bacterium]|nr:DUF1232 domain-containing protein [Lachnospiraceae bacterium]
MDIDKIINSYQSFVKGKKPEDVAQSKDETMKKVANTSVLAGLLENIRMSYDMVSDSVTGKYKGVSKGTLALLAGGLSYLALPLDLVPDFIPVAGWMDDAALLGWMFARCADEFKKYGDTKNPPRKRKA